MSDFACALRQLSAADARLSYPLMMLRQMSLTLTLWQTILRVIEKESATRLFRFLDPTGCLPTIPTATEIMCFMETTGAQPVHVECFAMNMSQMKPFAKSCS